MRAGVVAVVALGAAVAGGVVALGLGAALGIGDTEAVTTTVQVPAPALATTEPPTPATAGTALGAGFDPAAVYAQRSRGVVTIYADLPGGGRSQGSGFVVDRKGHVLTNAHVITNVGEGDVGPEEVRGAERLYVEFSDGDRVPAEMVGWDLFADVGAIRVDPAAHVLVPLPLGDSSAVVVGTPVAAIGSPFGNQNSLAVGVVSATGRSIPSLTSGYQVSDAIQIDAPINRGNSGGPLIDAGGRVIGINAQIRSVSGTAEGVGFAIPVNVARRSLGQLVSSGRVSYAYIGIKTQDVTPGIARAFDLAAPTGALVATVEPETPAARAALRGGTRTEELNGVQVTLGGDQIVSIAGRRVQSSRDVSRIVTEELLPGQRVPVVIFRDGERRTVTVTLGERPLRPTG